MKTTMKIAVIAMMGLSLGVNAQTKVISLENSDNDPNFVNKGGNVGIGTSNPLAKLDIFKNGNSYQEAVRLTNDDGSNTANSTGISAFLNYQSGNGKIEVGRISFQKGSNSSGWSHMIFSTSETNGILSEK